MRIAIVGAGGVGGYFGGRLVQAGQDVIFIARGRNLEALQTRGLQVDSIEGGFNLKHVRAVDDPEQVGSVDVVLLCVKAWQVLEVTRSLRSLLAPQTCVVPLQNGVEAASALAAELGREHVLGGLCSLIVSVIEPGHLCHTGGRPYIKFGELDNHRSARISQLYAAFARARGLAVDIPANIEAAIWEKFLFIEPWGSVGALTRAPIGIIRTQPGTRQILRRTMEEVFKVARARNLALPTDVLKATVALWDELPPEGTASMQRDIMRGVPSELEAQAGSVVRLGRKAGLQTPINALIYDSLLPMEMRARGRLQF
jgi:2-dehydropantoate 2-reductase